MASLWDQINAEEILVPIHGTRTSGSPWIIFSGLSTDSRTTRPGDIFWALKGERFDGHRFIEEAVKKGAKGVVAEKHWWDNQDKVPDGAVIIVVKDTLRALGDLARWWRSQQEVLVSAITGSTGKTTTKEMLACIFEQGHQTLKNRGNYNNLIGVPLTLLELDSSHKRVVMEMGMNRRGEIARLTEIAAPDIGLITNVGQAHLEGLGSLHDVALAKAELIEKISPEALVIVNGDDPLLMKTAARFSRNIVTFGTDRDHDFRAERINNLGGKGLAFELRHKKGGGEVRLTTPGIHNVSNALAACAVAVCLGEPHDKIVAGLSSFKGIKGRFSVEHIPGGVTLVNDTYNANPSSLKAALESLEALKESGGRILAVLGDMKELGDSGTGAHEEAGKWVAALSPHLFIAIGDYAQVMINSAREAGVSKKRAISVATYTEALEKLQEEKRRGDLIFVKGSRLMELEKVVEGLKDPGG